MGRNKSVAFGGFMNKRTKPDVTDDKKREFPSDKLEIDTGATLAHNKKHSKDFDQMAKEFAKAFVKEKEDECWL